jgi:1-acyl-sn-glycerol-3-phosphate acyltransferase
LGYTFYAALIFVTLFILLLPFFCIPIIFKSRYQWTGVLNRIWAKIFFGLLFFKHKVELRFTPSSKGQYIFCPNHFSYLDIPTMGLNPINSIFVGKNDMEKVPLFGWMYRKLHITVDRNSLKSKYSTIINSLKAVDEGKNLMIFPEGGMLTTEPPKMVRFKDGAFRVAIEKQIPIVPVTIPFNWIILPDGSWTPKRRLLKVIYHEPLETKGLTLEDIATLRQKTYEIIDQELKLQLDEN